MNAAPGADPVRTTGLGKRYEVAGEAVRALRDVSLTVRAGEMVALRGPSGCGKSTLLSILACAERPTEGDVYLNGIPLRGLSGRKLRGVRRSAVGTVFQNFHLLDSLTVRENVALPLALLGCSRAEIRERVDDVLAAVGLEEKSANYPPMLSGGQAQRVAIARAIVHAPALILADEPTGNLDAKTGTGIIGLLRELATKGRTLLIATHADEVAAACDRTLHLSDGVLLA